MIQWNDLLTAKTGLELFIMLDDALRNLSGSPELRISTTPEDEESGLRMEVRQTITVRHEDANNISRPVTQEFVLLQDGTLNWELKLTGEKIHGLSNIQARLRQVMEDSQEHARLTGSSSSAKQARGRAGWDSEWILTGGYVPKATKPTRTWMVPPQESAQAKKD